MDSSELVSSQTQDKLIPGKGKCLNWVIVIMQNNPLIGPTRMLHRKSATSSNGKLKPLMFGPYTQRTNLMIRDFDNHWHRLLQTKLRLMYRIYLDAPQIRTVTNSMCIFEIAYCFSFLAPNFNAYHASLFMKHNPMTLSQYQPEVPFHLRRNWELFRLSPPNRGRSLGYTTNSTLLQNRKSSISILGEELKVLIHPLLHTRKISVISLKEILRNIE